MSIFIITYDGFPVCEHKGEIAAFATKQEAEEAIERLSKGEKRKSFAVSMYEKRW
jgi:hypothetical protein